MALSILQFVNVHSTAATLPMPNSKLQLSNTEPGLKHAPSTLSLKVTSSSFTGPSMRTCCQRVMRADSQLNQAPSLKMTSSSRMLARAGSSMGAATTHSETSILHLDPGGGTPGRGGTAGRGGPPGPGAGEGERSGSPARSGLQLNCMSTKMQDFSLTSRPPVRRQPMPKETSQRTTLLAGTSMKLVTLHLDISKVQSLQSFSSWASWTSVSVQSSNLTSFPPRSRQSCTREAEKVTTCAQCEQQRNCCRLQPSTASVVVLTEASKVQFSMLQSRNDAAPMWQRARVRLRIVTFEMLTDCTRGPSVSGTMVKSISVASADSPSRVVSSAAPTLLR
mmetsp:Transcript_37778/g.108125  ORF Transcript_37778/g.108125 Transcript_37778/m.108125 type:complete len:335 (-) Transcript_37778:86-1090(-)